MLSGPGSIPNGLVQALYCDVSDLANDVWLLDMKVVSYSHQPHTISYDNSLTNVDIYSFVTTRFIYVPCIL